MDLRLKHRGTENDDTNRPRKSFQRKVEIRKVETGKKYPE